MSKTTISYKFNNKLTLKSFMNKELAKKFIKSFLYTKLNYSIESLTDEYVAELCETFKKYKDTPNNGIWFEI